MAQFQGYECPHRRQYAGLLVVSSGAVGGSAGRHAISIIANQPN
jgi:hypothetical protein